MRMVVEIIFLCFVVFIYGVAYGKIRFGRLQSEQRKPGHWIKISCDDEIYKCSECGNVVNTNDIDEYKYCYRCGCSMEEGD